MFVYIKSAAFVIVVTQKLVLQQSKNITATETLSPPPSIQFSLLSTAILSKTPNFFIRDLKFSLKTPSLSPESFILNPKSHSRDP